jgi:hypothetical protein
MLRELMGRLACAEAQMVKRVRLPPRLNGVSMLQHHANYVVRGSSVWPQSSSLWREFLKTTNADNEVRGIR